MICAKAMRLFCPPDNVPIFCSASGPPMPIVPRCLRISSGGVPGYIWSGSSRSSRGVRAGRSRGDRAEIARLQKGVERRLAQVELVDVVLRESPHP